MSNPIAENCGHDHGIEEAPANASAPVEPTSASPEWTAGPWEALTDDYGYSGRGPYVTVDSDSGTLVGVWTSTVSGKPLPHEANARLIAAAPDLYAALVVARGYVAEFLHRIDGEICGGTAIELARIDAALAKARGQ